MYIIPGHMIDMILKLLPNKHLILFSSTNKHYNELCKRYVIQKIKNPFYVSSFQDVLDNLVFKIDSQNINSQNLYYCQTCKSVNSNLYEDYHIAYGTCMCCNRYRCINDACRFNYTYCGKEWCDSCKIEDELYVCTVCEIYVCVDQDKCETRTRINNCHESPCEYIICSKCTKVACVNCITEDYKCINDACHFNHTYCGKVWCNSCKIEDELYVCTVCGVYVCADINKCEPTYNYGCNEMPCEYIICSKCTKVACFDCRTEEYNICKNCIY
jgi:hypothetical protein